MPGNDHGPSILMPRVYRALKRKGMSKRKAAKISNAMVRKVSAKVRRRHGVRLRRRRR